MAYRLCVGLALGSSQTGLTLSAQLVDTAGANVGSAIASGFTEIGAGNYLFDYAGFPDGHRGGVKFSSGGTLKAFAAVNPQEAENTDVKTSTVSGGGGGDPLASQVPGSYVAGTAGQALGRIGAGTVTYTGPTSPTGAVTIIRGDDYFNADNRALEWTDSGGLWPDLTGATVKFGIGATSLSVAGAVVTASGTGKKVRVELATAQTGTLTPGRYDYDVQATLASGHIVTLAQGRATILTDNVN